MAENDFYQCINRVFTINTIFGLSTFSVTKKLIIKSKKRVIYILTLSFAHTVLTAYCLFIIWSEVDGKIIWRAIDMVLLVLSTLYVNMVWIFNIFYQRRHISFILKLAEYNKRFKTTYGNKIDYGDTITFVKHRFIYYILFLTVFFTFIQLLITNFNVKLLLQLLCYIIPVTSTMGLSLQFTTYVKIMKSYLQFLNTDTKNINDLALASQVYSSVEPKVRNKGWSKNLIMVLGQMSVLHHSLCGFTIFIMEIYGVMMLGMIAMSFASVVIGVYYLIGIYLGYREEMHITQMLAIFFIVEIIFICHKCSSTVDEVTKTGTLIHKIDADEQELRDEIELFSLQIANEKVEFDVIGFFSVNYTLLFSVIGAATTYVIILIQLSHN